MFAYPLYVLIVLVIGAVVYAAVVNKMVRTIAICVVAALAIAVIAPAVGRAERCTPEDIRTVGVTAFDLGRGYVVVVDEDGFIYNVPFAKDNYNLGEERSLWISEYGELWLEPTLQE